MRKLVDTWVGKRIQILDARTGVTYPAVVADVRTSWGKEQIQLEGSDKWFEPSYGEFRFLTEDVKR